MIRLQPISSVGVTLRRSSGSLDRPVDLKRAPTAGTAASASGRLVIPSAPSSWKAKFARAVEALEPREALEQPLRPLAVLEVQLRERPARRALVDVDLGDARLDRGHDLDRAAARSRSPPRACRSGRRRGASAPCGRPGPRSCRAPGSAAPSAPRAARTAVISTSASWWPAARRSAQRGAPRPSARAGPRCRCGSGRARRGRAPRPRGRPGSRPGARSGATSAGSARTRTRTGARGRRSAAPG